MNYYEPDEQYFEPSEADLAFEEYKERMYDLVKSDIKTHYDSIEKENTYLKETNQKLKKEFDELKKKSENQFNIDTKADFIKDIFSKITKENVIKLISLIYKPDFNESYLNENDEDRFSHEPAWFTMIVNYYSNKNKIIAILRACDIKVPKYAETFRLPCDWTKEELNVFFDTIYNHYNCNGCTYTDNLRFWYENAAGVEFDPIKSCQRGGYSELPWQFVLRNKILNSPEYCIKMANQINEGGNGQYFIKVVDYQTLDEQNLKTFVNALDVPKNTNNSVFNFIIDHLDLVDDTKKIGQLFNNLNLESWGILSIIFAPPTNGSKYVCTLLSSMYFCKIGTISLEILFLLPTYLILINLLSYFIIPNRYSIKY